LAAIFFAQVAEITLLAPAIRGQLRGNRLPIHHDQATCKNDASRALVVV
jgi:hypothetical protein